MRCGGLSSDNKKKPQWKSDLRGFYQLVRIRICRVGSDALRSNPRYASVFPEESVFCLCAGGVPSRVGSVGIQSTGIFSGFWRGEDNNRRGSVWIVRHNNRGLIRRSWLYRILRQNGRAAKTKVANVKADTFFIMTSEHLF